MGFFRTRIASQNKKRKAVVVILLRVEDPLGAGSAELNSQVLTRVNPLSPNHRLVIALRSLGGVFETGLARRPSEKRSTKQAHGPGRDVFSSPVQRENPKNCADFPQFSGKCNDVSLHSRLRGGGLQSRANPSLRQFPANREKYRELSEIRSRESALLLCRYHIPR